MAVLFENIISPNEHITLDRLINLSECCRSESHYEYAEKLEEIIALLKKPVSKLLAQLMFEWMELNSPCFRFEYHKALFLAYGDFQKEADFLVSEKKFEEASRKYKRAAYVAKKAANNLGKWTAICPELVRYPPFHMNYALAMTSDALCQNARALYSHHCETGAPWKCGVVTQDMVRAVHYVEKACQWAQLANMLWARPDDKGGFTTEPDELEQTLFQQWYRAKTYAASTFQERLNFASMCCETYEDMQDIVNLNSKLYYLTPQAVDKVVGATIDDLCKAKV